VKDKYRSIDRVDQTKMPLVWIHGTSDELIPYEMGKRLFDAAKEPKTAHPVKGGSHNDLWQLGADRIVRKESEAMVAWSS